ncbi:hypothetical protein LMG27174_00841 [Paraburkholderia rhynchosiae]|nr:hypothetical protein LMG27174_00841 [Paraburkholderia rhynchosiae]
MSLEFNNGVRIELTKSDFSPSFETVKQSGMLNHLRGFLSSEEIARLYEHHRLHRATVKTSEHFIAAIRAFQRKFHQISDDNFVQWLDILVSEFASIDVYGEKLNEARVLIKENFPFEAIYLPTYRRIEEDFAKLTGAPINLDGNINVIQFGMLDVQQSFDRITSEIKNSSIQWFAKVNGQMLGQLINGINITKEMKESLYDKDALRIVLERIGDNMPAQDKAHMLELIETGDIFRDHDPLAYFLANLVKVYEQQKVNDNAIKNFVDISNKYLVDKKVVYDESAVEIAIRRKKNDAIVDIDTLSSGEKQVISLFARLFLRKSDDIAIFFDEPELSLSIEWQRQILPDILNSGACKFMICTTHSPFIFDNELTQYTTDLGKYIREL